MAKMDYQDIIPEITQPQVVDNVVVPTMEKLFNLFTRNTDVKSGALITDPNAISETPAGGAYTRGDANPTSMTQVFAMPSWTKLRYHESGKVRREDVDEALDGTPLRALLLDTATKVTRQLMKHVFDGVYAQIKADVDSASTYSSNGAITRVTALQSYEENTNTQITLALMRAAQNAIALKDEIDWKEYVWLIEQTVLNTAHPLMSETGSWQENNPRGQASSPIGEGGVAAGHLNVNTFDNIKVDTTFGMTVGDLFLLNRNDVQVQIHKPLELEIVPVDEYAHKMVARIGVNAWVRRPKFQAKLDNKD